MDVLNRKTMLLLKAQHTADGDFPVEDWVHGPDLSAVVDIDPKRWKLIGDVPFPMSDAEYLTLPITTAQTTGKIDKLRVACKALIESGVQTTAGGLHVAPKWYDSMLEDQVGLMGNIEVGDDPLHGYAEAKDGPKTYAVHTNAQLRGALKDGRNRILAIRIEYATLKAQAFAATTVGELEAVTWTMT